MRHNLTIGMDIIHPSIKLDGEIFEYITEDVVPGVYPYYMVTTCGRVYHRYLQQFMKPGLETSGYLFVVLSTINGPKIVQLNRLVLQTFNPIANPENYQANHKNGDKLKNYLENLEWTTRSENILHAYRTGLHKPITSISEDKAIEIVNLLKTNKYQCKEIANILNVHENIVNSIKKKQSWKHLTLDCEFKARKRYAYTDEFVRSLCIYFQNNPKPEDMMIKDYIFIALDACDVDNPLSMVDTARKIYTRKHYTNISKDYNF